MRPQATPNFGLILGLCVLSANCGKPAQPSRGTNISASARAPAPDPAPAAAPVFHAAKLETTAEPKLAALLGSHKLHGTIARLDGDATVARCSDAETCDQPLTPASTFKIPNSLIGLETGVIPDAEYVIPWDGVHRWAEAWNRDHSLRTALRESAVWYYQELARRVGKERMRDWLARLEYGNMQMGDVVDRFWLDGPLAVSPLQQVEFLRRLVRAQLPVSERSRAIVLDITKRGELDGKPFHGKTGWIRPGEPTEVGWFVGWVEDPVRPRYVAVALTLLKAPFGRACASKSTALSSGVVCEPSGGANQNRFGPPGPVPKGVDMMTIRQAVAEEALRLSFD
jgi:beta-lactamase class D